MKKKVDRILEYILIGLMTILVVDVLWQVFGRYVLSSPSSFTDELAGYLLIWVGMLGAAYVTGQKEHLAIDLLIQKSKPLTQKKLTFTINLVIALFAIFVMVIGGSWLMLTRFQLNVSSAALHLPLGYVYSVMPVSGLLMLYYSVVFMFSDNQEEI
ncbi:MAG: TRAP transporter small permease [Salinivirgaceae bacterium]|jgi:TRAP-type C4-dicarboxylate transport system permease small subunit